MRSLIWKQWRESRLLLILFCTWMVLSRRVLDSV